MVRGSGKKPAATESPQTSRSTPALASPITRVFNRATQARGDSPRKNNYSFDQPIFCNHWTPTYQFDGVNGKKGDPTEGSYVELIGTLERKNELRVKCEELMLFNTTFGKCYKPQNNDVPARFRVPVCSEKHADMFHVAWKEVHDIQDHEMEGTFNPRCQAKTFIDAVKTSDTEYVIQGRYFPILQKVCDGTPSVLRSGYEDNVNGSGLNGRVCLAENLEVFQEVCEHWGYTLTVYDAYE